MWRGHALGRRATRSISYKQTRGYELPEELRQLMELLLSHRGWRTLGELSLCSQIERLKLA